MTTIRRRHTAPGFAVYARGVLEMREAGMYHKYVRWHDEFGMRHDHSDPNEDEATRRGLAHYGPSFLPWHREFIWRFENDMKSALGDDEFGLPYWDWSLDKRNNRLATSAIWQVIGARSGPVEIRGVDWKRMWVVQIPGGQLIRRDSSESVVRDFADGLVIYVGNYNDVRRLVANTDIPYDSPDWNFFSYPSFRRTVEVSNTYHDIIHNLVGGDMRAIRLSPNDPVFFLHHAMVDRLWARWQDADLVAGVSRVDQYRPTMSEAEGIQMGHRIDEPMLPWSDEREMDAWGLPAENVTPRMVLDHRGERMNYRYDDQGPLWLDRVERLVTELFERARRI